jgi:hypothetical protein
MKTSIILFTLIFLFGCVPAPPPPPGLFGDGLIQIIFFAAAIYFAITFFKSENLKKKNDIEKILFLLESLEKRVKKLEEKINSSKGE